MKYVFHTLTFVIALLLVSCGDDSIVIESTESSSFEDGTYSYSLQFDAPYPHYDGEDVTRATDAGEWEDGDVVYITFSNGESPAIGKAVYESSTSTWHLFSQKQLENENGQSCRVLYFCAMGKSKSAIHIDSDNYCVSDSLLSKVFRCENAEYDVKNGVVTILAHLTPVGKRLRFKGSPGTIFCISGRDLCAVSGFGLLDNGRKLSASPYQEMRIKDDGFSDYILLHAGVNCAEICIDMDYDGNLDRNCYVRYFDGNTLKEKESGCFSMPFKTSLHGWSLREFVDLDLPSGLKWATCNVGAGKPEDFGLYFTWGDTVGYSGNVSDGHVFDRDNYVWCDKYGLTKYNSEFENGAIVDNKVVLDLEDDVAHAYYDNCRMPTKEEMEELFRNCSFSWTDVGGKVGYMVISKRNKRNFIFLPAAGYRVYEELNLGYYGLGLYWTSSSSTDDPWNAYSLEITSSLQYSNPNKSLDRSCGLTVRPVLMK